MRLIVVRHGETEDNVNGVVQGQSSGRLSPKGKIQVRRLALRLRDEPIQIIISSDLQRAKETTHEIAQFHDVPIYYTSELRERCAGIYEGQPREPLINQLTSVDFVPECGETLLQVKDRVDLFVARLFQQFTVKTILISSHGGWNKMLFRRLLNKPIEEPMEFQQDNACLSIIEAVSPSQCNILLFNCTTHLTCVMAPVTVLSPSQQGSTRSFRIEDS
jgi:broad specificity phosphatase PhoE